MAVRDLVDLLNSYAAGDLSRRRFLAGAVALGLSASLAERLASDPAIAAAQEGTPAAGGKPGPAADRLLFSSFNVDQAPLEIQSDKMDLYLFGLKTPGAKEIAADPKGVRLIEAPASTLSLLLNPAPPREGELNPFALAPVRQAMQFLVDRQFIADDIFQGRAAPMLSHVSPLDPDEITVFETLRKLDFRHDPEYANSLIAAEMEKNGASLDNGVWSLGGKPIQVKMVIRVEDERRDIGDLVRAALEGAGFAVQPIYQPFGPATLAVYASDPLTFQWHIYTEGWGRSSADRYDFGTINQMAAPWLGNMPGWLETGFWQYENKPLDEIGQKLYRGEFASREERDEIYRTMTGMALDESVRVWLATALQSFPVRESVSNLTEDIVGGPKSPFALREASVEGSPDVRVGHLWIWTDRTTWNPVGGLGDVYSGDIYKNLVDAPILSHPFSGLPMAYRASFEVETAGPDGTLQVPESAVLWDAKAKAWAPVAADTTAVSTVTYDLSKYFQAPYHHGPMISMADLVYSIAQGYELAYDESKLQIETAIGITSRPFLETVKGIELLDDNRFAVHVDFWHFEPDYIASYATVGGVGTPWELLAAMDDVVFTQRRAAYSDTAAARFSLPWLSLVTESDARLVDRTLRDYEKDQFVPPGVFEIGGKTLVTPEQAAERYAAAQEWFDEYNMLVISNGPFFLARYDPPAQYAELQAFRADGYPFSAGDWVFGAPPSLELAAKAPAAAVLGEPVSVPVTLAGPGALSLQYALVDPAATDPAARVLASGAASGKDGAFTVEIGSDITAAMFPGVYQLYLLGASDELARVTETRFDLEIGV